MTRIIGYARVSKREQAEDSHALEQQQNRLRVAGAEEILTDVESGRKDDRPQFQQLMELVRQQRVERVVVTRIDRLGRSLPSCAKTLEDFQKSGVLLQVLDGSVDLTTVGGRTQAGIMAVLAQMESEMISDRSRHGWEYLRQRRVAMNAPFGYRKVEDRHQLDHETFLCLLETGEEMSRAKVARDLVDLFMKTRSLRQTIRALNEKYGIQQFQHTRSTRSGFEHKGLFGRSPSGLRRWLTSPVLRGHLVYFADDPERTQIIHDTHADQRLISDEEYRSIEEILGVNRERRGWGAIAPVYPLSGLVKCSVCGSTCYSSKAGADLKHNRRQDYGYYFCRAGAVGACTNKNYVRMDVVEDKVITALIDRANGIADLAEEPLETQEDPKIVELRAQIEGLEKLASNFGSNPALEIAKQDISAQIEGLRNKSKARAEEQTDLIETLLTLRDRRYWDVLETTEKRSVFRLLVERIDVKPSDDQPLAITNNKKKTRQRFLNWEIQVFLKL
ncbi:recombinase family protein [Oculatella sp. FACHB-28]|uniref:fdxN element excision recombinase XisF n=1 Tax=Oculatella sp. FACHB-28 TaxID=2692845 RepID=UPI001687E167|nr:fdxN element excision recombinase XisF [Oculatella sp. FACHB-28]MBD2057899.1 recombinase family protein [Oculatella sp. FACHB-28]